jgi:hypothetical protein
MTDRRALCVGINQFANLPMASWLYGCVNDAKDMASLLRKSYGFGSRDVVTLTDDKATKAAIMARLNAIVDLAVAGKVKHIVFTYSSHGTQVPDANGDELDRADEALVAYDLAPDGDAWDLDTVIVDDELHALFARVPADVLVEAFLDTCHSGTGLKAMDILQGRRPKFLPPPTPIGVDGVAEREVVQLGDKFFRRKRGIAVQEPVLFAACKAAQTSSDASFNGRSSGAFTYNLLKALKAKPDATRAELLTAVRAGLKADRFSQIPQLEAPSATKKRPLGH